MNANRLVIAVILFFITQDSFAVQLLQGRSIFSPRSQSTNAARELVGWHPYLHQYGVKTWYAAFSVTPSYSKSVRPDRIADALFGTNKLFISGSLVPNRNTDDILADYFGLSPAFIGIACLDPYIQNSLIDFNAYFGIDDLYPGLYFRIHAPIVWTKWDLQLTENILNNGVGTLFPALYMDNQEIAAPVQSFVQALRGGFTYGQQTEPLLFGIVCGSQSEFALSDIQFAFGWDFILCPDRHIGISLRAAAPTGTRPNGIFLFEPIVGNGKHWELGVGVTSRTLMWERDCGDQELSFFADVNVMHLFKARQKRSFDLCANGFGSRYVLTKEFNPSGQYIGQFAPTINKTTLVCDVSVDIQLDIVFMAGYRYKRWLFDVGYNGWIRSREKIGLKQCLPENKFGLKGIQNVAFIGNILSDATQSMATLEGNQFMNQDLVIDPNSPVFFNTQDLNLRSGASPLLITHKIFGHVSHEWKKWRRKTIPFLGIGGEIEFQGINENTRPEPHNNTLSQWSIWLKGGIAF